MESLREYIRSDNDVLEPLGSLGWDLNSIHTCGAYRCFGNGVHAIILVTEPGKVGVSVWYGDNLENVSIIELDDDVLGLDQIAIDMVSDLTGYMLS